MPLSLRSLAPGGAATAKACVSWGGYHDKVMLLPRRHMRGGLGAVATAVLGASRAGSATCGLREYRVGNSEQLLRRVLTRHGVTVTSVPPDELPLVDGRCSPHGWCLVEPGKDCWPAEYAWEAPPCSGLNATEAQRLLYAQRWVERRTILPSLARGVALTDR